MHQEITYIRQESSLQSNSLHKHAIDFDHLSLNDAFSWVLVAIYMVINCILFIQVIFWVLLDISNKDILAKDEHPVLYKNTAWHTLVRW
jgi:hypothetical protein